jgi:hypothetical protein
MSKGNRELLAHVRAVRESLAGARRQREELEFVIEHFARAVGVRPGPALEWSNSELVEIARVVLYQLGQHFSQLDHVLNQVDRRAQAAQASTPEPEVELCDLMLTSRGEVCGCLVLGFHSSCVGHCQDSLVRARKRILEECRGATTKR